MLLYCCLLLSLFLFAHFYLVPSDVFFINSLWKGFYEYLGKRQPATLTVDWFNTTSSKVNATFIEASNIQLKLSGRFRIWCSKSCSFNFFICSVLFYFLLNAKWNKNFRFSLKTFFCLFCKRKGPNVMVCTDFCQFVCSHPSIFPLTFQINLEVGFFNLGLLDNIDVLNSQVILKWQTKCIYAF